MTSSIEPQSVPALPMSFREKLGLVVVLGGVGLNLLLLTAISPILSTAAKYFDGEAQGSWLVHMIVAVFGNGGGALVAQSIITMSGIGIMVGSPIAGWLAERIGLRAVLLLSLVLYGVAGSSGLYVESVTTLLLSRLIQGMSSGGIAISTFAMIGARFGGTRRARILGYQGAFVALLGFVTGLGAGKLGEIGGWRAPFGLYLLSFVMLGMGLVATGLPSDRKPRRGASGGKPDSLAHMWPIYLMCVPLYVAAYMVYLHLSFVLAGDGVKSPLVQSQVMLAITAANFMGGLVYGRILERLGARNMFLLILCTMGASDLVIGTGHGIPWMVVGCALAGLGGGSLVPFMTNLVLTKSPDSARGKAMGFMYTAMYIGDFLNPVVVTPMRGWIGNHAAFAVIGLLLILAAVPQALIRRSVGHDLQTRPA